MAADAVRKRGRSTPSTRADPEAGRAWAHRPAPRPTSSWSLARSASLRDARGSRSAFGGLEQDGAVHVTSVVGTRTRSLDGLVVRGRPRTRRSRARREAPAARRGLRLVAQHHARLRPRRARRGHLHAVRRSGHGARRCARRPLLRLVVAVADRRRSSTRPAFGVAGELGTELRVREEVQRRLAVDAASGRRIRARPGRARGAARELCRAAQHRRDRSTIRACATRLAQLEQRLAALSHDGGEQAIDDRCAPLAARDRRARVRRARRDERRDRGDPRRSEKRRSSRTCRRRWRSWMPRPATLPSPRPGARASCRNPSDDSTSPIRNRALRCLGPTRTVADIAETPEFARRE